MSSAGGATKAALSPYKSLNICGLHTLIFFVGDRLAGRGPIGIVRLLVEFPIPAFSLSHIEEDLHDSLVRFVADFLKNSL